MGVSNVNNQNQINMIKLAMQRKAGTAAESAKPDYLKMTGSIWNAPQANKTNATKDNLNNLNTLKSLNDLNDNKKTGSSMSNEDMANIDNASDGRKAASQMENQADSLKSQTKLTEQNTKLVNNYSADSQKLDKQIQQSDKKFAQQLQQEQAQLKKDNMSLQKLVQEQEETQKEVNNAQHELDSLMASSSFSIRGGSDESGYVNPNQDKINELQELIGSKVSGMQQNGKAIYSLQRSQSRTLSKMGKTNAKFIKTQQNNTKALEKQEKTTDKIINVATKIEQISTLVTLGGQALNMAGAGLIALGSAMSGFFGAGAALIAAGTVMQKVGTVVEMVGNYGSTAANLTKTAAYAADGNIAGALQSATSATMTGAAAVKQTKGLKDTFGQINDKANEATQKLAANTEAKKQVSQVQNNAVNDLAKQNGIDTSNMSNKDIEKALKEKGISKDQIKQTKSDALGGVSVKDARKATSAKLQAEDLGTRRNKFAQAQDMKDALSKGDYAKTAENLAKDGGEGFKTTLKNVASKTASKSSSGFNVEKFTQGLQMTAAVFGQMQQNNTTNPIQMNNYRNRNSGRVNGMSSAYSKIASRRRTARG